MKKRLLSILLALCMMLALLPERTAQAADSLKDWYFLFAIFKSVDADCYDGKGSMTHTTYTMTREELNIARKHAQAFESYMNRLGVMRAHAEIVEIDETVTELGDGEGGSWLDPAHAAPFLEGKVDLDRYDHVFCTINLNVSTDYLGGTDARYENGTGNSCINFQSRTFLLDRFDSDLTLYPTVTYVHEFLHFVEYLDKKWGDAFNLHEITINLYHCVNDGNYDDYDECYTDIILNRVNANEISGTGAAPAVWQYPPRELRTARELIVPAGVTGIGDMAFQGYNNLERVVLPGSVTNIGHHAFCECGSLRSITIPSSVTSIEAYAFYGCVELESAPIPSSVTSIGKCAFYECKKLENASIPSGVTSINEWAFAGCSSLKSVTIPGSASKICKYAFCNCGSLESVTILSGSLASIDEYAFYICGCLKSMTMPDSVSSIGKAAFGGSGVKDVYYSGTENQWRSIQFDENNAPLINAAIHYSSIIPGDKPEDGGKLHGQVRVSAKYAPYGEQVAVTLIPDPGYKSESLTVVTYDGKTVPVTGSGDSYTFSMPAADVTLYVEFIPR